MAKRAPASVSSVVAIAMMAVMALYLGMLTGYMVRVLEVVGYR